MLRLVCAAVVLTAVQFAAAEPDRADSAIPSGNGAASNVELFYRPNGLLVAGTNVHLQNMVVRAKSGTMMRVTDGRHEIFVAPIDPSSLDFIAVGARVDVRGTLRDTPSAAQARLELAMSAREARRLTRQHVYVDAWSVMTPG